MVLGLGFIDGENGRSLKLNTTKNNQRKVHCNNCFLDWLTMDAYLLRFSVLKRAPFLGISAQVRPHHIFDNNMVLQRDKPVRIWGSASPGEKVEVEFMDQVRSEVADEDGEWKVYLDPEEVRYAWVRNFLGNAVNASHYERIIPVPPFRTDGLEYPEAPYEQSEMEEHKIKLSNLRKQANKWTESRKQQEAAFVK